MLNHSTLLYSIVPPTAPTWLIVVKTIWQIINCFVPTDSQDKYICSPNIRLEWYNTFSRKFENTKRLLYILYIKEHRPKQKFEVWVFFSPQNGQHKFWARQRKKKRFFISPQKNFYLQKLLHPAQHGGYVSAPKVYPEFLPPRDTSPVGLGFQL